MALTSASSSARRTPKASLLENPTASSEAIISSIAGTISPEACRVREHQSAAGATFWLASRGLTSDGERTTITSLVRQTDRWATIFIHPAIPIRSSFLQGINDDQILRSLKLSHFDSIFRANFLAGADSEGHEC